MRLPRRSPKARLILRCSSVTSLIGVPGVDYVGPVPKEFQQTLVFAAAVGAKAKEPEPANAFITYLTSPAAAGLMKKYGMDAPQP